MSSELREEIQFGLENLTKVSQSIAVISAQDIPENAKDPALAFECLGYYNALEHLIIRFLKHADYPRPSGAASHRDAIRSFVKLCEECSFTLDAELL